MSQLIFQDDLLFDTNAIIPTFTYEHPNNLHFQYSNLLERAIAVAMFGEENVQFPEKQGYHPDFDFEVLIGGEWVPIEMKVRCALLDHSGSMKIEVYRPNRIQKSALQLSKSKYYLLVTHEFQTKDNLGHLIKVRLVATDYLRYLGEDAIKNKQENFCIRPNRRDFLHAWLGDFRVNSDGTWNLNRIVRKKSFEKICEDIAAHQMSVDLILGGVEQEPIL
jgi:hypothetical protein